MPYRTKHTIDTAAVKRDARLMSEDALRYSANDAHHAALAAEVMERAGYHVSKSGGFYRDEAVIYREELRERGLSLTYRSH